MRATETGGIEPGLLLPTEAKMAASFTQPVSSQVEAEEVAKLAQQISDHAEILYQTWRTQKSQSSTPSSPTSPTPNTSGGGGVGGAVVVGTGLSVVGGVVGGGGGSGVGGGGGGGGIRFRAANSASPEAVMREPSKRHSQYLRNAVNLLGSPGLERQLEELVQNFIVEDKVRNAQRLKSPVLAPRRLVLPGGNSPVLSAVERYEKRFVVGGGGGGGGLSKTNVDRSRVRPPEGDAVGGVGLLDVDNMPSGGGGGGAAAAAAIDPASSFLRQVEEDLINALKDGYVIDGSPKPGKVAEMRRKGNNRLVPFPTTVPPPPNAALDGYESASPRLSPEPLQLRTSVGGNFVFPGESLVSPVDYAKVRYQHAQEQDRLRVESVRTSRALSPNSLNLVSETRSRFETKEPSPVHQSDVWTIHDGPTAESTSQMAEWFRRKAARKGNLPHPELTEQQRQHIKERSMSPTTYYNAAGVPIRPFLTRGSVAERVLIFEKCPTEVRDRTGAGSLGTWRTNEVQSRAQTYARVDVGDAVQGSSRSTAKSLEDHHPQQREQQKRSNNKDSIVREPDERAASKRLDAVVGRLGDGFHHHRLHQPAAGLPTTATPSSATLRRQARAKPAQIPRFYYPMGRPKSATELEQACRRVADAFDSVAQPFATREDFAMIAKACDLPLYLKAPLFFCAVAQGCHSPGQTTGSQDSVTIGKQEFLDFWRRTLMTHHDVCAQFIHVLSRGAPRGSKPYLLPEDLVAMVQDIVDTHPGLAFLREAQEFHFRYVRTVIARIYYCVNRSWSGRITLPELRRSNLLQVISMLETEEDINQITEYFSYEHFYVIYCKFWELDRDHDLFIDRLDLARHADGAISSRMIDRIFSGAVTRGQGHTRGPGNQLMRRSEERHRMSYPEFIWFLISEEDKRHPTAVEYWFRCMDLDGDGYLSMYELEYFYEEQVQRLEAMGMEAMPFNDCLCQMLDLVQPAKSGMISLGDLKRCHQTPIFFDTFFNLEKYLEHEHRDPFAVQARDPDNPEQQVIELSDWEKYCIEEYEQLVAEEGAGDATEIMYDDDMEDESGDIDELSPNLDQIIIVDAPDGKHIVTEPDDDFADYADA